MKRINRASLFNKIELFEKLAIYGDRQSFLQALAQEVDGGFNEEAIHQYENKDTFGNPITTGIPAPGSASEVVPATEIKITPDQNFTSIPAETQNQLNELLAVNKGVMSPIAVDGKNGPETRAALQMFSKTYGVPASVQSIKDMWHTEKTKNRYTQSEF